MTQSRPTGNKLGGVLLVAIIIVVLAAAAAYFIFAGTTYQSPGTPYTTNAPNTTYAPVGSAPPAPRYP